MRIIHLFIASFLMSQPAYAEFVEVPLRADGTVNLDQVLPTLKFSFPLYESGAVALDFSGEMLGEQFVGRAIDVDPTQRFTLMIDAPTHSEQGNFLIAVLATDIICLRGGFSPGSVLWSDTKRHNGTTWEVSASCASPTD